MYRILSIDGGGIRGIIPATILTYLESCLQKNTGDPEARIADYFDLIAGTSTGAILTALLLTPDEYFRPRFTAMDTLDFYKNHGGEIFHLTPWQVIKSVNGFFSAKYSPKLLEALLMDIFGNVRLSELLKPCIIPCFDIQNNCAVFFNQKNPKEGCKQDFFVREIIRATTAAPSYFPVAKITSCNNMYFKLIDGGVFANNPTTSAYIEAHKINNTAMVPNNLLILSLGTGSAPQNYNTYRLQKGGITQWAFPLFDILLTSNSEITHHTMEVLFKRHQASHNYLRIQTDFVSLDYKEIPLDARKPKEITMLCNLGLQLLENYKDAINTFSLRLITGV